MQPYDLSECDRAWIRTLLALILGLLVGVASATVPSHELDRSESLALVIYSLLGGLVIWSRPGAVFTYLISRAALRRECEDLVLPHDARANDSLLAALQVVRSELSARARSRLRHIHTSLIASGLLLDVLCLEACVLIVPWLHEPEWPRLIIVGALATFAAALALGVLAFEDGGELYRLWRDRLRAAGSMPIPSDVPASLSEEASLEELRRRVRSLEEKCDEARRKTLSDLVTNTARGIDQIRRMQQNHTAGSMTVILASAGLAAQQALTKPEDAPVVVKHVALAVIGGTTLIWLFSHIGFCRNLTVKLEVLERYLRELGRDPHDATLLRRSHSPGWRLIGFVSVAVVVGWGIWSELGKV
jgi:hypothetical protein